MWVPSSSCRAAEAALLACEGAQPWERLLWLDELSDFPKRPFRCPAMIFAFEPTVRTPTYHVQSVRRTYRPTSCYHILDGTGPHEHSIRAPRTSQGVNSRLWASWTNLHEPWGLGRVLDPLSLPGWHEADDVGAGLQFSHPSTSTCRSLYIHLPCHLRAPLLRGHFLSMVKSNNQGVFALCEGPKPIHPLFCFISFECQEDFELHKK